jgi:hypothetical protein
MRIYKGQVFREGQHFISTISKIAGRVWTVAKVRFTDANGWLYVRPIIVMQRTTGQLLMLNCMGAEKVVVPPAMVKRKPTPKPRPGSIYRPSSVCASPHCLCVLRVVSRDLVEVIAVHLDEDVWMRVENARKRPMSIHRLHWRYKPHATDINLIGDNPC